MPNSAPSAALSERHAAGRVHPAGLLPALLADLLGSGHAVRLRVTGASMEPVVRPGDHAWLEPCAGREARIGDLILFERAEGGLALHRVVRRCRGQALQTGGDALGQLDLPVEPGSVLGRVTAMERNGRVVRVDRWRARWAAWRLLVGVLIRPFAPIPQKR